MKRTLCSRVKFYRTVVKFLLGITVPLFLIAGLDVRTHADPPPSFTFTATIPPVVTAGDNFTFPATITDIGGPAVDYNSYFQIYTLGFFYQGQTFFTNQTFDTGTTLDYNPVLTAPTTPGEYYVAALMFNEDYTSGIVDQEFFSPTFDAVPATVPEPSAGLAVGVVLVGLLCLRARIRNLRLGRPDHSHAD